MIEIKIEMIIEIGIQRRRKIKKVLEIKIRMQNIDTELGIKREMRVEIEILNRNGNSSTNRNMKTNRYESKVLCLV